MGRFIGIVVIGGLLGMAGDAVAYERRAYAVTEKDRAFEIRDYAPAIVAETIIEGDFEEAGNKGFRILFAYISGENEKNESIEMLSPATQEPEGEKIAMTAPVTQETAETGYRFTFMMPSSKSLETLPNPLDQRIRLSEEPAQRYATVTYSGFWSQRNYERHLGKLRAWMSKRGIAPSGGAVWARYDPPFMPWFWRTNEILIPVAN